MKQFLTISFFLMLFGTCDIYAQTDDDNILIENKVETYEYSYSKGSMILTEQSTTDYRCVKWPETISVVEFYDNYSEINNATAKAAKKISPNYQMYQQDGIFYSDTKVCYFNLPFTKKDETASVSFKKIYKDISLFTRVLLFEPQYVKQKTIEIAIPSWMSVEIIEKNVGDNIEKSKALDPKSGTVTYKYIVKDQESVIWQADAPGYYRSAPYLIIIPRKALLKKGEMSFFNDYDAVYKWCKAKADMTVNDADKISIFTQQIIAECKTEEGKIAKIFTWVQGNIRYLAFNYGLLGWVPDNAQDVLRKKYGDCKGMANLLKVMLCSAGLDARLAWIGTNDIYSDQTITLPLFNHLICALFRNGEIIYLDPTVKYMVAGEYHEAIQGRHTMIEDRGRYILGRVPDVHVSQNTDSLYSTYHIDGKMLVGKIWMTLRGESKHSILSQINALESSRRMNVLKQFLEIGQPQDKVTEISIEGDDSMGNSLCMKYNVIRNGSINNIGNEIYVNMDSRADFGLSLIDTVKRKSDIKISFRELTIREEYLEIPDGFVLAYLPEDFHIENDIYRFDITYRKIDGKVQYRKEIEFKDIWLTKQNFDNWNKDIHRLKKNYLKQVVIKKI